MHVSSYSCPLKGPQIDTLKNTFKAFVDELKFYTLKIPLEVKITPNINRRQAPDLFILRNPRPGFIQLILTSSIETLSKKRWSRRLGGQQEIFHADRIEVAQISIVLDRVMLLNPIRPSLFSRSPGPRGLRGPDAKNRDQHQPIKMKFSMNHYGHESIPAAKFESDSSSSFEDMTSQNVPQKKGTSHEIRLFTPGKWV